MQVLELLHRLPTAREHMPVREGWRTKMTVTSLCRIKWPLRRDSQVLVFSFISFSTDTVHHTLHRLLNHLARFVRYQVYLSSRKAFMWTREMNWRLLEQFLFSHKLTEDLVQEAGWGDWKRKVCALISLQLTSIDFYFCFPLLIFLVLLSRKKNSWISISPLGAGVFLLRDLWASSHSLWTVQRSHLWMHGLLPAPAGSLSFEPVVGRKPQPCCIKTTMRFVAL